MYRTAHVDPLFRFVRIVCYLPFLLPCSRFSFVSATKTITRTPLPFAGGFISGSELSAHVWESLCVVSYWTRLGSLVRLARGLIRVIPGHLAAKVLIAHAHALREVEEEYQG